ncbi:MAG: histidine--tRNA ligase, partial [Planifilum fulgidum]
GIGCALGLDRILVALKDQGIQLPVGRRLDCYVVTLGEEARKRAIPLLAELRRAGCSAERDVLDRKMKGQMKAADRERSRYVVILGEEELSRDAAVVKEMATGRQEEVRLDRLVDYIRAGSKR